ncbi:protein SDA1 homolog, partial [Lampetra fluviatilis]
MVVMFVSLSPSSGVAERVLKQLETMVVMVVMVVMSMMMMVVMVVMFVSLSPSSGVAERVLKQLETMVVMVVMVVMSMMMMVVMVVMFVSLSPSSGVAERLLKQLETSSERFEVKLLMMNFVSRLVGIHELFLFNLYPFLQRFMQPHQRDVTKVLMFGAQASHSLVPPEVVQAMVMHIANNFVTDRNSGVVMCVGINAIREISARCPLAMTAELLTDLAAYKTHRDKNVMMSSKGLIHLYRTLNPALLHKKDRGRPTEASVTGECALPLRYGETRSVGYVPGRRGAATPHGSDTPPTEKTQMT